MIISMLLGMAWKMRARYSVQPVIESQKPITPDGVYKLVQKLLKTELSIDDTWFAKGITNNPDNVAGFQGWHAENILFIFDEGSGIAKPIWEAAGGAMSGGNVVRFVVIGNPNLNSGPFYDAFKDPTFNKIRISAFDIPNVQQRTAVVPGLTDHFFVEELATRYGVHSPVYKMCVLGEFPDKASNTLIGIDLIENAFDADRELQNQDDDITGLDVARFGDDDSALVNRKGNKAKVEWVINGNNTMELAGKSAIYLRANKATKLHIDITGGLGTGTFDRLREQPDIASRVFGINVAGQARDSSTYIKTFVLRVGTPWRDGCATPFLKSTKDFMSWRSLPIRSPAQGRCSLRVRRR